MAQEDYAFVGEQPWQRDQRLAAATQAAQQTAFVGEQPAQVAQRLAAQPSPPPTTQHDLAAKMSSLNPAIPPPVAMNTAPLAALSHGKALGDQEPTIPTVALSHGKALGESETSTPYGAPSVSSPYLPDQAQYHVDSPAFNPPALAQRVGDVVNLVRGITGQLPGPEVAYDLARSAMSMPALGRVVNFMLQHGAGPDMLLAESGLMAHNIAEQGQQTLQGVGDYLGGVGQRLSQIPGQLAEQTGVSSFLRDIGQNNPNKALVDIGSGLAGVFGGPSAQQTVQGIIGTSAAAATDIQQALLPKHSAFGDQGFWVPGPNGTMVNSISGKAVQPFTPAWDQANEQNHMIAVAPNTNWSDQNPVGGGGSQTHTVADIRNDLYTAGYIKDPNRTGPLQQDEVSAWRQWYDHEGGQNVSVQLQMQAAGFGQGLPITGFFNPTNADGTVNETGQRWLAQNQDYVRFMTNLNDYIAQHPDDAVWMRDHPQIGVFLAWFNGDDAVAKQLFAQQRQQIGQTPITGGFKLGPVAPLTPFEIAIRGALSLANTAFSPLDALPNKSLLADKIWNDPQVQSVMRQAYDKMTPAEQHLYELGLEGHSPGILSTMQMVHDPVLRAQLNSLALKHLSDYGYYSAQGGPLGTTDRSLGGLSEVLAGVVPDGGQTQDFLEQHPLVADAANMLLTWKLVPGRFGSSTKGVAGVPGLYARVASKSGGVVNPIAKELGRSLEQGRYPDMTQMGSIAQAGTSHPHMTGAADFQPAQAAYKVLEDFHPQKSFFVQGSQEDLARAQGELSKSQMQTAWGEHPATSDLTATEQTLIRDQPTVDQFNKQLEAEIAGTAPKTATARYGERTSQQLVQQAKTEGGFTYQPHAKMVPTNGYAVVTKPERSQIYAPIKFNKSAYDKFVADNMDILKDPNYAVGAWKGDDGKIYLEISQVVQDEAKAVKLGKMYGQKEYYDFASKQSKPVEAGEVPHQPAGPGAGPVAPRAVGGTGLTASIRLPWEYDRLRDALAGKNVKVFDGAGNVLAEVPRYDGPKITRAQLRAGVAKNLDELNQKAQNILTTRMTLPVRLNNFVQNISYNPVLAPLARNFLVKAFNGVIEHADAGSVNDFGRAVDQYVHDPALRRAMRNQFYQAFTKGPAGYPQSESLIHQLTEYVREHYKLDKDISQVQIERQGTTQGFTVQTPIGPVERSIFPTELGGHAHYIPNFDAAVQRGDVPAWLKSAEWRGSDQVQAVWKGLDEGAHDIALRTSRAAEQLSYWLFRKPATFLSLPFMGKAATKAAWTTMLADVKASRAEWRVAKQGLSESPLGQRLLDEVYPQQFLHDPEAYFGNRANEDASLADRLQARSRDDVIKVFRDVYSQPLKKVIGDAEYSAMGVQLRATIDETRARLGTLRGAPQGGEAWIQAQADIPKFEQQLARAERDLKDWRENRTNPHNGGATAMGAQVRAWLQTPAGQYFKDTIQAQDHAVWDAAHDERFVQAANAHMTDFWYDQPHLRDAMLQSTTDGEKLLQVAKQNNELFDEAGRAWVPTKSRVESVTSSVLAKAWDAFDRKMTGISYAVLSKTKNYGFRELFAQHYARLRPAVEAGKLENDTAMVLALTKARDMANDLYFDLSSSMLQIEKRLRFPLSFITKRRLFWQQIGAVALSDPKVSLAMTQFGRTIEGMNQNENQFNKDKLTFTLPFGIMGYAKGSTIDVHVYNQLWLGQNGDEIENYALLKQATDALGVTHPDPAQNYQSVFGYYPSAQAPQASLIPRFGDWWIWANAARQMEGIGGQKTLEDVYRDMPASLVAQHQRLTNAILAQSYRSGQNLSVDDAAQTAFLDLLMHSTAKIGLPGAPGITPEEQVAAKSEVQQYWAATSKQQIDALEQKYPGLVDELRMTRDPNEFKQNLLASAQAAIIQQDFSTQVGNFEGSHQITALITDKVAQEQLAQIKRVRDQAYAQLAEEFPIWGESHGYGYRDANGVWKSNDDVKRMLAQRGSPLELAPGREGVLQQAQKMYSNFVDANNIVPVSKADHDTLLKVMETYSSLDDAIARYEALPESDQNTKTLADLRTQRSRFIGEYQNILDAYWPHGQKTTLEAAREQWYKDVYTPWVAAQKPIFDQLDPTIDPYLTSKQKGALEDQLTAIKNTFYHPFTLPQYPGTTFPAPEQINWQNKQPADQAQKLAYWQVVATHNPEWLTKFQRDLLTNPDMLKTMITGWDRGTYNLYISTLRAEIAKEAQYRRGGFSFGGGGYKWNGVYYRTARDAWRAQLRASGRETNIFSRRVAVTNEGARSQVPANVFA